tara:strand:+ start:455 stop:856 length:402 start_codon:yes stop_codon:yes gene_type:complete
LYQEEEIISATAMLLAVAKADEILENDEIDSIKNIIVDFFKLDSLDKSNKIIQLSKEKLTLSTDIFEFGRILNKYWDYQDKVDFICCTFELGYSDGTLHYLEEHIIKKISTILNVNHKDLIDAKIEMKDYLID